MAIAQTSLGVDAESIAARIDRLPITSFHRHMLLLVSFALFFDECDYFSFSYAAPGLMQYWGISIDQVALITSAVFVGMFFGSITGGMLSDRVGRKRTLMIMVAVVSLSSLANALAPNLQTLVLTRCVTGFGASALIVVVMTYISEMFPSNVRGKWQAWAMVIGLCAIPITGWVARLVVPLGPNGWRFVFIWGSLGVLFLFLAVHLEESPRWLSRHGQEARADEVLSRIEARVAQEAGPLSEPAPRTHVEEKRAHWTAIFEPRYRRRTATLWGIWCFQAIGFFGFQSWAPTLLVKQGIAIVQSLTYISLINVGVVPGALLATWLAERVERKYSIATSAFFIAFFGLLYGLTFKPVLIVAFGFVVGMLLQTSAALTFAFTPEQYPTDVRNIGAGVAYSTGRLANVANPFIVAAIYTKWGYVPVFVYIAGAWIIAGTAALFGAKTTGRRLEVLSPVSTEGS